MDETIPPPRGREQAEGLRAKVEPGATPVVDPLHASVLLPPHLLQGGEVIILLVKPSPWFVVLSCLRTLVVITVAALGMLVLERYGFWLAEMSRRDIILLAFGAAGVRLFWQFLEWLSHVYVLTDRRVIRVRGVLRVQIFEAGLKQIQHTGTYFSIRERLFGLGTIGFATAGAGGNIEAYWHMVANPLEVHQVVVQSLGRYR